MAANPNPARVTDQMWTLWEDFKAAEPLVELGGIYANKPGYHGTRNENSPTNYSVAQYPIDRQGPGDKAAAIDLTFPDAQAKPPRYGTINKYSQRLFAAGQAGRTADPRTVYMREFYGNIDTDSEVEGWDYARHGTASSDSSHLWHIHISVHRGYVTDPEMTRAILSILKGETVDQWRGISPEEDDEVKMLLLQDANSIVLYTVHPVTGELYWMNAVTPEAANAWEASGVKRLAVDNIGKYGRSVAEVSKEVLDAMRAGGGGSGTPSGQFTFNGTATAKPQG